ncbi:hypothetical protein Fot_24402 [Forsythia ovata]|uniref:Uncharacterized protein n=1 Tax=Forsythia ovata TaxID=205694 RepID=A0ABD1U659_9LAMI
MSAILNRTVVMHSGPRPLLPEDEMDDFDFKSLRDQGMSLEQDDSQNQSKPHTDLKILGEAGSSPNHGDEVDQDRPSRSIRQPQLVVSKFLRWSGQGPYQK